MSQQYLFPNEPMRFSETTLNELLVFCVKHEASDITFQTSQPVIAEITADYIKSLNANN